jgi:hypothetical protein
MARVRDAIGLGMAPQTAQAAVNTSGQVTGTGTGSQGAGVVLSYANNDLVTASSLDTFVLPTAAQGATKGDVIYATVETSTSGVIYPGGTDTIVGSTSAKTVAQHKTAIFVRSSATNWGYFVTA